MRDGHCAIYQNLKKKKNKVKNEEKKKEKTALGVCESERRVRDQFFFLFFTSL